MSKIRLNNQTMSKLRLNNHESTWTLTWTSCWILWVHPRILHFYSWPVSVGPDYAAYAFLADLTDPTAGPDPLYCALCTWGVETRQW